MAKEIRLELPSVFALKKMLELSQGRIITDLNFGEITNRAVKSFNDKLTKEKTKNDKKKKDEDEDEDEVEDEVKKDLSTTQNVVSSEFAYLNNDEKYLEVEYSILVNPFSDPTAVNNIKVFNAYKNELEIIKERLSEDGKNSVLFYNAAAYAYNMINGSIAFRNRENAIDVKTIIKVETYGGEFIYDFSDINGRFLSKTPFVKREGSTLIAEGHPVNKLLDSSEKFRELVELVKRSFLSENKIENVRLTVLNKYELYFGAKVYPSELFINKGKENTRRYYKILDRITGNNTSLGFTPEKIGNALRTYDAFFSGDANLDAISIEPLGSVSNLDADLRSGKDGAFDLFRKVINEETETLNETEILFIIGNIIRGGLFNK